jgi:hypothetical protein
MMMAMDDDEGDDLENYDDAAYFIYSRQRTENIPRDLTRVKVNPSVKVILAQAFDNCSQLTNVQLHEGLEKIGERAFCNCTSLHAIVIPPSVKEIPAKAFDLCSQLTNVELHEGLEKIGWRAFCNCSSLHRIVIPRSVEVIYEFAFAGCSQLTNVELHEGLEKIGERAFCNCRSLHAIVIPPSVELIDEGAFNSCSRLTNVELHEGLEKIGRRAFCNCTSLHRIVIPSSVEVIDAEAFHDCSHLTNVEFCEEIEEFVSGESMRDWWNHGVHEKSLSTYCFFARCNIPERVGLVKARKWQFNIHEMLRRIPSISPENLSAYFDFINSKLSVYESLKDVPMLLELAIYRNNGILNTNIDDILNTDIVPCVLSYLTDGYVEADECQAEQHPSIRG